MSNPFVAEIRIFPFNFPPKGWAFCNGQLMPISQNTALFSLLGTTYGGDGKSTFALPDLQGRAPMHPGEGQGLSQRFLGENGGEDTVTLLQTEMPSHTHSVFAAPALVAGDSNVVAGNAFAKSSQGNAYAPLANNVQLSQSPPAVSLVGGNLPHNNMQPYLTLNFCIAMQGVFPARP